MMARRSVDYLAERISRSREFPNRNGATDTCRGKRSGVATSYIALASCLIFCRNINLWITLFPLFTLQVYSSSVTTLPNLYSGAL
jgi:hypothetical protein